jgi:hypothetical protein
VQHAVTAIYRTSGAAEVVRDELERLGVTRDHVTVLPDHLIVPDTTDANRSTTTKPENLHDGFDRLHDLHLSESDTRIYQQAIRNGDYVVSASVDSGADLDRIEQIMRRPEHAYSFDDLDTGYRDADYVARRQPLADGFDERMVGQREERQMSPFTRRYRRALALRATETP